MAAEKLALDHGLVTMPAIMMNSYAAYPISVAITAGTMVLVTAILGRERRGELIRFQESGWLRQSQVEAAHLESPIDRERGNTVPVLLGLAVIGLGLFLSFVVFV
jgi:hypothetical protein